MGIATTAGAVQRMHGFAVPFLRVLVIKTRCQIFSSINGGFVLYFGGARFGFSSM